MSYFPKAIDRNLRQEAVKEAVNFLGRLDFDAFAGRGLSGITMAAVLAHVMDKHLLPIRKITNEQSSGHCHDGIQVPMTWSMRNSPELRVVIVDDFTNTGTTIQKCVDALKATKNLKILGVYFYQNRATRTEVAGIKVLNIKVLNPGGI